MPTKLKPRNSDLANLEVLVRDKTLYHGSSIPGIREFEEATETTVGRGIYLTSEEHVAIGYAKRRAERTGKPVIYECTVDNLTLLDLRKDENVRKIMKGFREILVEESKKLEVKAKWYLEQVIDRAIAEIDGNGILSGNVRKVTYGLDSLFTKHLKSLGYDGLIAIEGGEGGIDKHDTYLIFDPRKVKIIEERKL